MNNHRKTFTNIALVSQVKRTKYNINYCIVPVFEIVYYSIIVRFIIVLPSLFSIVLLHSVTDIWEWGQDTDYK